MRALLVSTYESGHQPLHLASPAARLVDAGHEVRLVDLSVERLPEDALEWADAVALSVPMHTAMRLGVDAARRFRALRADLPIAFYGLYAPVGSDATIPTVADRAFGGEYEGALGAWFDEVDGREAPASGGPVRIDLRRQRFRLPARRLLPPLRKYAHFQVDGHERLVGYVEASHGCSHHCRHCPIPPVYGGRIRIVQPEVVIADIEQLVEMGAGHITFGDPDFLNGVHHSLRVVREMHRRFPDLTFDVTTKVEHIVRHRDVWAELAGAGLAFVISAFETTNDRILALLDKGHVTAQAADAVRLLRRHGVEIRPSWMPFTPWTSLSDLASILEFIAEHDLYGNIDPVQLSIRLLIPEGSLLLDLPEMQDHLDGYDAELLTYRWRPQHPDTGELQRVLAGIAAEGASEPADLVLGRMWSAVEERWGRAIAGGQIPAGAVHGRPRVTEPWFC